MDAHGMPDPADYTQAEQLIQYLLAGYDSNENVVIPSKPNRPKTA
jgi:hypothetical protein